MVYEIERQKRAVRCFLSKARAIAANHGLLGSDCEKFNDEFHFRLFLYALGMKNRSFSEEKEWRILQVRPDQRGVNFRPARGIIIPFVELSNIPLDVFASVTLGPAVEYGFRVGPMELFLKRNQLEHVKIRTSQIPVRALC